MGTRTSRGGRKSGATSMAGKTKGSPGEGGSVRAKTGPSFAPYEVSTLDKSYVGSKVVGVDGDVMLSGTLKSVDGDSAVINVSGGGKVTIPRAAVSHSSKRSSTLAADSATRLEVLGKIAGLEDQKKFLMSDKRYRAIEKEIGKLRNSL